MTLGFATDGFYNFDVAHDGFYSNLVEVSAPPPVVEPSPGPTRPRAQIALPALALNAGVAPPVLAVQRRPPSSSITSKPPLGAVQQVSPSALAIRPEVTASASPRRPKLSIKTDKPKE